MSGQTLSLFPRASTAPRAHRLLSVVALSLMPLTAGCAPLPASAITDARMPSPGVVCGLAVGSGSRIACSIRPMFSRGEGLARAMEWEAEPEDDLRHAPSRCLE